MTRTLASGRLAAVPLPTYVHGVAMTSTDQRPFLVTFTWTSANRLTAVGSRTPLPLVAAR
jgi:hypothetical protein